MGQRSEKAKKIAVAAVIVVFLLATFTPVFSGYLSSDKEGFVHSPIENTELIVSFLDVGQGDATLILSESETILIDTGLMRNYDKLLLSLSLFDIEKIDTLILTHPDSDHCGSAGSVVSQFLVQNIIVNQRFLESKFYPQLIEVAEEIRAEISIVKESSFTLGDAEMELVSFDYEEDNDNSIVTFIDFFDTEFLLTADIGKNVEGEVISYFNLEGTEVLKAAHHGSNSSTGEAIIEVATPVYSIISVGDNSYGHPHGDVLDRLSESEILRTDINGDITFYISKEEIFLSFEN